MKNMKTGTASTGVVSILLVFVLSKLGVHLGASEAAAIPAVAVTGAAWILHHGGLEGLWKAITHGQP